MPSSPTIELSWRFRVSLDCTEDDAQTSRQRLLYEIVRSWLWLGTGWTDSTGASATMTNPPWAVVGSSDGVAYDGTNRWTSLSDLVWGGDEENHSHIQLVHQHYFGTDDPLYVLFDCSQSADHDNATLGIYIARRQFIEGSVGTRPAAEDEIEVKPSDGTLSTAAWQGGSTVDEDHRTARLHFMMSSDGRFVRVIICRGGVTAAFWDLLYDNTYNSLTQWSHPVAMCVASGDDDGEILLYSNLGNTTICRYRSRDDVNVGGQFPLRMCMVTDYDTAVTERGAITMGGAHGAFAIPLACITPASGAGASRVRDAWWGRTANAGQQFPNDGTMQFTQFGIIIVPWNRTIAQFG